MIELVSFISIEDEDDLILSFYIVEPDDPAEGRSLILMRSPKWEVFLPEDEWGVKVSDESWPYEDKEEWQVNLLERIRLGNSTAEIKGGYSRHKLDLRRVEKSELRAARKLLKKMNFDKRFKLEVA